MIGCQGQRADLGRRAEQQRAVQRVESPVPAQAPAVKPGIEKQDRQHGGERELETYVEQIARPDGQHQRRRAEHDVVSVAADRGAERHLRGRQHQGRADDRRRQPGHNGVGPQREDRQNVPDQMTVPQQYDPAERQIDEQHHESHVQARHGQYVGRARASIGGPQVPVHGASFACDQRADHAPVGFRQTKPRQPLDRRLLEQRGAPHSRSPVAVQTGYQVTSCDVGPCRQTPASHQSAVPAAGGVDRAQIACDGHLLAYGDPEPRVEPQFDFFVGRLPADRGRLGLSAEAAMHSRPRGRDGPTSGEGRRPVDFDDHRQPLVSGHRSFRRGEVGEQEARTEQRSVDVGTTRRDFTREPGSGVYGGGDQRDGPRRRACEPLASDAGCQGRQDSGERRDPYFVVQ